MVFFGHDDSAAFEVHSYQLSFLRIFRSSESKKGFYFFKKDCCKIAAFSFNLLPKMPKRLIECRLIKIFTGCGLLASLSHNDVCIRNKAAKLKTKTSIFAQKSVDCAILTNNVKTYVDLLVFYATI